MTSYSFSSLNFLFLLFLLILILLIIIKTLDQEFSTLFAFNLI